MDGSVTKTSVGKARQRTSEKAEGGSVARRPFRSRQELHDQIIEAAGELFASRGFAEPSIREIAEAADVALPALYRLFVDKRDIYVHCCKRAARTHQAIMATFFDVTDADEVALYKMWRSGLALKRDKIIDFRLMQRVINDGDFDILQEEIDDFRQSDLFLKMLGIVERLGGKNRARLRIVIMETFFNHVPAAFQSWPAFQPLEDDLDILTQDILAIFFPAIDWSHVASSIAASD